MFTDPIADYLTRIRNANSAGHMVVDIPASKLKKEITNLITQKNKFEFNKDLINKIQNHYL